MPKFRVYAIYTASKFLGEVEAESAAEAENQGWEMDTYISVCHQCANDFDLNGDPNEMQVEEAQP